MSLSSEREDQTEAIHTVAHAHRVWTESMENVPVSLHTLSNFCGQNL